ncbi:MAG: hypothetical protein M3478_02440 [Planctomycetota bacterium]|nr:hypothetical protein [Planctomycetota bacterium]
MPRKKRPRPEVRQQVPGAVVDAPFLVLAGDVGEVGSVEAERRILLQPFALSRDVR